jgi:hypothetical protein
MNLRVYNTKDLQQNQKIGMHLVSNENVVYFIDTDNISQTILMHLGPMYITDIIESVESSVQIVTFLWKNTTLDFLDKDACAYFRKLLPNDISKVTWIPSVKEINDMQYFLVPVSPDCTAFDNDNHIVDTSDCLTKGNIVETIIAVKGFRYCYNDNEKEFACEILYEIFQAKVVNVTVPKLNKCETSLFLT